MSGLQPERGRPVPAALFHEYITETGLTVRLTLLRERLRPQQMTREQLWDLNLEIEHLFSTTPFPEALQLQLLQLLDSLGTELVVSVARAGALPESGAAEVEFMPAATRADALAAIRGAWARSLLWDATDAVAAGLEAGLQPLKRLQPEVTVIEAGDLSSEQRPRLGRRWERLPDGRYVELACEPLRELMQRVEKSGTADRAAADAAFVRYACGVIHNRLFAAPHPFAFFDRLARPAGSASDGRQELRALAERTIELEDQLVSVADATCGLQAGTAVESAGGAAVDRDMLEPQQLVGSPAAAGCAAGRVWLPGAADVSGTSGAEDAAGVGRVLVCERLSSRLLQQAGGVAAVVESTGGRVGLGALLALRAAIPCVSGVSDAALLPQGIYVRVDGYLGLVSVGRENAEWPAQRAVEP